ncbi:MAG: serine/threonine-protein kinase [Polyangiaceae bacterium]
MDESANTSEAGRAVGELLAGRYRIERIIGEGGMGAVYEGKHTDIGKRVAIKLVHSVHMRHPEIEERFKREARSASAIESEHIVHIFDVGHDEHLGLFMVMEFLKGEDLAMLLTRMGRVDPFAACAVIAQAASGLQKAHEAGIIHRDLKPANVFLCSRDDGSVQVKLVDFGIAKFVRDANQAESGKGLTRMGMAIGTPQYMSPEQAQGLPDVDERTDVYSLGGVLFEALTGEPPVKSYDSYEMTIVEVITKRAPRVSEKFPGVHPDIDQLVADMMEPEPVDRIADMATVRSRIIEIYPEIADIRLPMGALSGDLSKLSTTLTGRGSGVASSGTLGNMSSQSRIRLSPLSEPRPGRSSSAVTMSEATLISDGARSESEPTSPRKTPIALIAVGAVGLLGLGAAGAIAFVGHDAQKPSPVLATSAVTASPALSNSTTPTATLSAPTPTVAPSASAVASAAPVDSGKKNGGSSPGGKGGKSGASAPATAADPTSTSTRPGAVNVSSEF